MRVSVQFRLLAGFGVVVALMLAVGLFSITRLDSDKRNLGEIASKVVPGTRAIDDIHALMNTYRKDQLHYILARPADRPVSAVGGVAGDLAQDLSLMSIHLDSFHAQWLGRGNSNRRLVSTFKADFARYVALTASFATLADQNRTVQASELVGSGPGDRQWDRIKADITVWSNDEVKNAAQAAAASRSSYRLGALMILAVLIAAVTIAALVAIRLARRMTRAVREIGTAAKAISEGDTDQHVIVRGSDEFGDMARDFDSMVEYLRSKVILAGKIAMGELEIDIVPCSERDALGNSLAVMTDSLRRLVAENESLLIASREEANTDALTSLPNRRSLINDLDAKMTRADGHQFMLGVFDLDGFKLYNDMFGHAAGDALLVRLADRLQNALKGAGTAYRLGGDEFCVIAPIEGDDGSASARRAASALSEKGEAFTIGCSYGVANIPREANTTSTALHVADQRMYEHKNGRASASRQSADVLLRVLTERDPTWDCTSQMSPSSRP